MVFSCTFTSSTTNTKDMESTINNWGETVTRWQSYKHPDNPNFQQVVYWTVVEKKDGSTLVYYCLDMQSKPKQYFYDLTKDQAISMYR